MLSELLQGTDTGGFLIVQDNISHSGRPLLKSFISAALNRDEDVHVLAFEASEEELKDGLQGLPCQRLHIHNAYIDPLGWTAHPAFTVQQFCFEELTQLAKQTSQPKPATLVIDSLSWILRHLNPPHVCKTLQQLRKGGAVRAIIGLLHADMHQRGTVGSICHLATSVIAVSPGMKADEAVAKTTKRAKSGKVTQDMDPTANLTFNLRLSDTEREAKEKLALPFVFSKEKKMALLQSGPGSGRILYEPDANDDYDQEDPDDDLDV
ncbi:elongator complex protein 5 isoform X2 [Sphaeramia orbicularis]|uniref:elongator complex protein 5 isoform X2 n=1 Tax=Sphaeramia orbicularis TaxID=375764 RepID=UPI0011804698|nr:elongator complex protein 5 isoform X2 [Sphaeramia orbicularis]